MVRFNNLSDMNDKQLSSMKMFEGQDGASHVELGTSLIAPHVALVVPWRLGVDFEMPNPSSGSIWIPGCMVCLP